MLMALCALNEGETKVRNEVESALDFLRLEAEYCESRGQFQRQGLVEEAIKSVEQLLAKVEFLEGKLVRSEDAYLKVHSRMQKAETALSNASRKQSDSYQ